MVVQEIDKNAEVQDCAEDVKAKIISFFFHEIL